MAERTAASQVPERREVGGDGQGPRGHGPGQEAVSLRGAGQGLKRTLPPYDMAIDTESLLGRGLLTLLILLPIL